MNFIKDIDIANKFAKNHLYWLLTKHSFFMYCIVKINVLSFFFVFKENK